MAGLQAEGSFQGGNNSLVFCLVVRGSPDGLRKGSNEPALLIPDNGTYGAWTGIAPGGAVSEYNQLLY